MNINPLHQSRPKTLSLNKYKYFLIIVCVISSALFAIKTSANTFASENEYTITEIPQWVIQQRYQAEKNLPINQPIQYLLIDNQINLTDTPVNYRRFTAKILTTTGVDQLSEIKIQYNPAYQKLFLHNVTIIRNNNTRDALATSKIRILQQEQELDEDIHMGTNDLVIILQDVRVGDILDFDYSIQGRNPIFGNKKFGYVSLDWEAFIDKTSVRILSPKDNRVVINTYNSDKKLSKATIDGLNEYSITLSDVKPVLDEGEYPYWYSPFSWIEYSEYQNWNDVNNWADSLYDIQLGPVTKINNVIQKIKANSKTTEEFITQSLFFIQNEIRYLGLEFGENSHRPHHPDDVLEKRFGDCKDKSLLLSKILSLHGIESYPALVSTSQRHRIKDVLPSPGAFNHVITLVIYNGQKYWLDGTRTYQAGKLDSLGKVDYGYALLIGSKEKSLIKMYEDDPTTSNVVVEEDIFSNSFDDAAKYKIKTTYTGNLADYYRYKFENIPIDKIKHSSVEFLSKYYDQISPQSHINIEDDKESNRFTVFEEYQINDYWKKKDEYIYSNINNYIFTEFLTKPGIRKRTSPYYLGSPINVSNITRIHYPTDVGLTFDGQPVVIDRDYISYKYLDSYEGSIYTSEANLNIKKSTISKDYIEEYISTVDKINKGISYTIQFKKPVEKAGDKELLALKKRLKELSN